MSADRRLGRLYPALTAKERAILILRAWKAGEDHDPKIRSTIPTTQVNEYNRLIGLMRGTGGDISHFIVVVSQQVEQLSLRWAWLASLHVGALNASLIADTALAAVPGRKEKAALKRSLRERMVGFSLALFDDPRWTGPKREDGHPPVGEVVAEALVDRLRESWPQRWREMRAVEVVVAEVTEEFDGEDPLHEEVRAMLDECRTSLLEIRELSARYTGELAGEEPAEALLTRLREIARSG